MKHLLAALIAGLFAVSSFAASHAGAPMGGASAAKEAASAKKAEGKAKAETKKAAASEKAAAKKEEAKK